MPFSPGNSKSYHIAIFGDERSIHIRRWVVGLRGLGHRVDLITLKKKPETDIGGIGLGATGKFSYLTKISLLKEIIKTINPELLHVHYASSFGFLASFIKHPRKILSVWGDDIIYFPHKNYINSLLMRKTLQSYHKITATSNFLLDVLRDMKMHLPPAYLIPFGVDTDQFQFFDRRPKPEITIGIAKHLDQLYGIDTLIRAANILTKNYVNVKLSIAGTGPYENEYKNLANNLGLVDIIKFVGHIPYGEMPAFLHSIDIATMPSRSDAESFGVAAIEAAATGLPVVGTRVGGVPEVIIDGVTGFLVEKENPAQLAEKLRLLIENPELRTKMGIAGRNMVLEKYRWSDCLMAMQNIYNDLMASA